MVPVLFYLHLLGAQGLPISVYLTATLRFVTLTESIRILSPVGEVVDTTALELKYKIAITEISMINSPTTYLRLHLVPNSF